MLGGDELSRFVVARLLEEGIDVAHICCRPDARPIRSTIIVDRGRRTRTILYELGKTLGADPSWPPEDVIRAAKVLVVDHFGTEGMIRAARIARDAGIPVVADFESGDDPLFPTLLALVDHLILSRDFACKITGYKRCGVGCTVALDAPTPSGGGDLRRRRLLVYNPPRTGKAVSSARAGGRCRRHDRLRRRLSRRLCRRHWSTDTRLPGPCGLPQWPLD